MSLKALAIAALFAASTAALATPLTRTVDVALVAGGSGSQSAGVSATHTVKGEFTDTFHFIGFDGSALVNGVLETMGKGRSDIDFSSITLNGLGLEIELIAGSGIPDHLEIGMLANTLLSGPFTLIVSGVAGADFDASAGLAASYTGSFNFRVPASAQATSTVPEPAGLALVGLAGAAALVAARRRRAQP